MLQKIGLECIEFSVHVAINSVWWDFTTQILYSYFTLKTAKLTQDHSRSGYHCSSLPETFSLHISQHRQLHFTFSARGGSLPTLVGNITASSGDVQSPHMPCLHCISLIPTLETWVSCPIYSKSGQRYISSLGSGPAM